MPDGLVAWGEGEAKVVEEGEQEEGEGKMLTVETSKKIQVEAVDHTQTLFQERVDRNNRCTMEAAELIHPPAYGQEVEVEGPPKTIQGKGKKEVVAEVEEMRMDKIQEMEEGQEAERTCQA